MWNVMKTKIAGSYSHFAFCRWLSLRLKGPATWHSLRTILPNWIVTERRRCKPFFLIVFTLFAISIEAHTTQCTKNTKEIDHDDDAENTQYVYYKYVCDGRQQTNVKHKLYGNWKEVNAVNVDGVVGDANNNNNKCAMIHNRKCIRCHTNQIQIE